MEEKLLKFLETMKQPSSFEECNDPRSILGQEVVGSLIQTAMQDEKTLGNVLLKVSSELPQMDSMKACCSAYLCGSIIEQIGVNDCGKSMVEFYCEIIHWCYQFLEFAAKQKKQEIEDLTEKDITPKLLKKAFLVMPDAVRAYLGCNLITLAIMDVITRDHSCRKLLRQKDCYEALEAVKEFIPNVDYVTQVYDCCMKLPLLVLAPKAERGFLAEVNDISNCFCLLTFLEAELYKSGLAEAYQLKDYQFNEEFYQCATGESMPFRGKTVYSHEQYYNYQVLGKEGTTVNDLLPYLIWGELPPEQIPQFHGMATIIIDPDTFVNRSWGAEFLFCCHNGLTPYFHIIRELTKEEVQERLSWSR